MKLGILLRIAATYMMLVGLGLIFAPRAFGTGAVPADASAELIAFLRLWGSPLLGIAVLDWMARDLQRTRSKASSGSLAAARLHAAEHIHTPGASC